MTLPRPFSSVCAAAGIIEHKCLAIAAMFDREGSGQGEKHHPEMELDRSFCILLDGH